MLLTEEVEQRTQINKSQKMTDAFVVIFKNVEGIFERCHYMCDYDYYIGSLSEAKLFKEYLDSVFHDYEYAILEIDVNMEDICHSPSFNHLYEEQYSYVAMADKYNMIETIKEQIYKE